MTTEETNELLEEIAFIELEIKLCDDCCMIDKVKENLKELQERL